MNIQNIAFLEEQLQSMGFDNTSSLLLKRIAFKPDNFVISQRIEKGKEQLRLDLFFEKAKQQDSYALVHYDAILEKEMSLTETTINGISTSAIENKMAEIDWKIAFELDENKQWCVEDKATWEEECKIQTIIDDLAALEVSEEGKTIAINLKIKHWAGASFQELFGNISPLKNKSVISQRFYFSEGHEGISMDEAFRFLQNKRLEKEMQGKRKPTDDSLLEESKKEGQASTGNGLLRKKRSAKRAIMKKTTKII
jgi:hypothetical protein